MKNKILIAAACAALGLAAGAAGIPYAFNYAGSPAMWPVLSSRAGLTLVQDTNRFTKFVREWRSPDGKLVLRSTEKAYKKFPVHEYLPELVCAGDAPTEIVEGFRSFTMTRPAKGAVLRALRGTVCTEKDFEPVTFTLGGAGGACSLVATEGRSSAQWMPWMGVDFPEGDGLEIAVGWSGAWRADAVCTNGTFSLSAGMVKTHFRLLPGETIRQPSVLVFTRAAGVTPQAMQTLIHRFMIEEKCPRDAQGRLIKPILPITAGGGNKTPAMMRKIIDWSVANKMPFDCFWVDAGWNGPAHMPDLISNCGNMWYHFVGDWRFNPTVHPDGNLAQVADAAHAAGMRMLLWVEPERCVSDPPPPVFREHRDWLLPAKDEQIRNKRQLNVNLGNPAAREWVTETVSALVRDNKLDIYRQDFNMNTLPLWQGNDSSDRQGITEAKYIAGLYLFWDTLRARFPHLIIENCAWRTPPRLRGRLALALLLPHRLRDRAPQRPAPGPRRAERDAQHARLPAVPGVRDDARAPLRRLRLLLVRLRGERVHAERLERGHREERLHGRADGLVQEGVHGGRPDTSFLRGRLLSAHRPAGGGQPGGTRLVRIPDAPTRPLRRLRACLPPP